MDTYTVTLFERGGVGETTLHPVGLCAVLVIGIAMIVVPRRYAMWPMIVMACFIAPAQRVMIAGMNFNLLRIAVVFGWARILLRGETAWLRRSPTDVALVAFAVAATVMMMIQDFSAATLVFRLGQMFDACGLYFLTRTVVRNWDDIRTVTKGFIIASVPVAACFVVEQITSRNLFAFLGGVPEITAVRDGRLRCQGAFPHPILAGSFWAALMPLIGAFWWSGGGGKRWAATGLLGAIVIIVMCSSSTPIVGVLAGVIGAVLFPLRHRLRWILIGIVVMLVLLHLVMKAPVWFLIARINIVGGNTAWHRAYLIDRAVAHFNEWWLCGTRSTAHWGHNMWDITNQYLLEGARGGLISMLLLIVLITVAFLAVGRICRQQERNSRELVWAWALGVTLFVHCVTFLSISYTYQAVFPWYLTLGMITSLAQRESAPAKVRRGRGRDKNRLLGRRSGHPEPVVCSPQAGLHQGCPQS